MATTDMQRLLKDICETSGISRLQAETALGVLLTYLGARLPSPVMGRIRAELSTFIDNEELHLG